MTQKLNPVKQLLKDLRGGISKTCDWCGKEMTEQEAQPEEAGEWICMKCWQQCEDAEEAIRRSLERPQ